jgi:ankyrin repeat protein
LEIINALIADGVDLDVALNMHRPSRGGNSGRFIEEFQNTGCTPLMRAAIAGDAQVAKLLLDKGANPNVRAMGLTPFLVAAGVGTGGRGTGLAGSTTAGGAGNPALMDVMLQHGADINAKVDGTKTYSMRISRAPNAFEGMTALQVAVQTARLETVKYLVEKGADREIKDASGRKAIDLVGTAPGPGRDGQPVAAAAAGALAVAAAPAGGAPRGPSPAALAEIRALLQGAAK